MRISSSEAGSFTILPTYKCLRLIQLPDGESMRRKVCFTYTPRIYRSSNMETSHTSNRIHPLMAGAAASVMLVSLLGAAAITGILPASHSTAAPSVAATASAPAIAQSAAPVPMVSAPAVQTAPVAQHKTIVHHRYVTHTRPASVAQAAPNSSYAQPSAYHQSAPAPHPVAQNSPVGIGVGAVVGGLLGSQVGGGNGKTLATIAGAVGGGYVGNEIAKRY